MKMELVLLAERLGLAVPARSQKTVRANHACSVEVGAELVSHLAGIDAQQPVRWIGPARMDRCEHASGPRTGVGQLQQGAACSEPGLAHVQRRGEGRFWTSKLGACFEALRQIAC